MSKIVTYITAAIAIISLATFAYSDAEERVLISQQAATITNCEISITTKIMADNGLRHPLMHSGEGK